MHKNRPKFIKASATGNDFLLTHLRNESDLKHWDQWADGMTRAEIARKLCHRTQGLGADGLVILEPHPPQDFRWDFYNSDGSSAEMCGNAARCAYLYYQQFINKKNLIRFKTSSGIITAESIDDNMVAITMPSPIAILLPLELKNSWQAYNTGVPHAVLKTQVAFDQLQDLIPKVAEARALTCFAKTGTNVTFYQVLNTQHIRSVTFERGVDSFTQSCGTGAVAAAICHMAQPQHATNNVAHTTVEVPGGLLQVEWAAAMESPRLIGPVQMIAHIEFLEDFLHSQTTSVMDNKEPR